jgi:hypothetical protein
MQLITIQEGLYTYDINGQNGMMFKPNHQYCYTGKVNISTVCCGDTEAYVVPITTEKDGVTSTIVYNIPKRIGVETTVIIQKHYQDFYKVWTEDFLQNREHHYYGEINRNCINCNGYIPHGDYSNNVHTGGFKDPDIVFKKEDDE